jgi:hypothetical protein
MMLLYFLLRHMQVRADYPRHLVRGLTAGPFFPVPNALPVPPALGLSLFLSGAEDSRSLERPAGGRARPSPVLI